MNFSENLRKAMAAKNISQTRLSELTEIPQPTISQYLSGGRPGSPNNILKIAKILNVTSDHLLGNTQFTKNGKNKKEDAILDIFRKLNIEGQEKFLSMGNTLLFDPENTKILN